MKQESVYLAPLVLPPTLLLELEPASEQAAENRNFGSDASEALELAGPPVKIEPGGDEGNQNPPLGQQSTGAILKLFHDQYSQVMASENGTLILNMALQYLESATSNLPPPPTVH
ncbi:hypothetical protein L596_000559 [Steinernema carpocapsae]|uniref:Uncharacterized protein n=1 Tax=Steinernema carpocapsae TaxID=34508 RepID=A0A4U8UJ60_STECR|nr:hypothetical protein L596_000559 [Steinernema carpocapsae]